MRGCVDSDALNFDPGATVDAGSCYILGCPDSSSPAYTSRATVDDGSCVIPVRGCRDPAADNFQPLATADGGVPCVYVTHGPSPRISILVPRLRAARASTPPHRPRRPCQAVGTRQRLEWPRHRSLSPAAHPRAPLRDLEPLGPYANFGTSVSVLGDLDGNGALDLAVGAVGAHGEDRAGGAVRCALQARAQMGGADVAALALVKASAGVPWAVSTSSARAPSRSATLTGTALPDVAVGAPGCDGSAGRQQTLSFSSSCGRTARARPSTSSSPTSQGPAGWRSSVTGSLVPPSPLFISTAASRPSLPSARPAAGEARCTC